MNENYVVSKLLTPETLFEQHLGFKLGAKEFADNLASNVNVVVEEDKNELLDRIENQLSQLDNEQSNHEPQTLKQDREKLMKYHYAIKNDIPANMNNRISVISDTHGDALALLAPYVESGAVRMIPGKYNYVDISSGEVYDNLDEIPNHESIFSEENLNAMHKTHDNFVATKYRNRLDGKIYDKPDPRRRSQYDAIIGDFESNKSEACDLMKMAITNNQEQLDSIWAHKDEISSLKSEIETLSYFNGQKLGVMNTNDFDNLLTHLDNNRKIRAEASNAFERLKKFMSPKIQAKSLSEVLANKSYKSELQNTIYSLKNQFAELETKQQLLYEVYENNCNIKQPIIKEKFIELARKALDDENNQTKDDVLSSMTSDQNISSIVLDDLDITTPFVRENGEFTDARCFTKNFSTELLKAAYPASNIVALPAIEKVPECNARIFHLGDLVDRGAEGIPSLCLALQLKKKLGDQARFLAGNHEISANMDKGTTHYHSALRACFDKKLFEPSIKVETNDGKSTYFGHCTLTKEELPIMFKTMLATQVSDKNLSEIIVKRPSANEYKALQYDIAVDSFAKFRTAMSAVLSQDKYKNIREKMANLITNDGQGQPKIKSDVLTKVNKDPYYSFHNYLTGNEYKFNDDDFFLMRDAFIETQCELYKNQENNGIESCINDILPGFLAKDKNGNLVGPFFIAARTEVNGRNKLKPSQFNGHTISVISDSEVGLKRKENVTSVDLARGYGAFRSGNEAGKTLVSEAVLDAETCTPVYENHNIVERDPESKMLLSNPNGKVHKSNVRVAGIDLSKTDSPYNSKSGARKDYRNLNAMSKKLSSRWSAEKIGEVVPDLSENNVTPELLLNYCEAGTINFVDKPDFEKLFNKTLESLGDDKLGRSRLISRLISDESKLKPELKGTVNHYLYIEGIKKMPCETLANGLAKGNIELTSETAKIFIDAVCEKYGQEEQKKVFKTPGEKFFDELHKISCGEFKTFLESVAYDKKGFSAKAFMDKIYDCSKSETLNSVKKQGLASVGMAQVENKKSRENQVQNI